MILSTPVNGGWKSYSNIYVAKFSQKLLFCCFLHFLHIFLGNLANLNDIFIILWYFSHNYMFDSGSIIWGYPSWCYVTKVYSRICFMDIRTTWFVPQTAGPPGNSFSTELWYRKSFLGYHTILYSARVWLTEEALHMKTLAISQTWWKIPKPDACSGKEQLFLNYHPELQ